MGSSSLPWLVFDSKDGGIQGFYSIRRKFAICRGLLACSIVLILQLFFSDGGKEVPGRSGQTHPLNGAGTT